MRRYLAYKPEDEFQIFRSALVGQPFKLGFLGTLNMKVG